MERNNNFRFIAKIKQMIRTNKNTGEEFESLSVYVDNTQTTNKDGTENKYYKGALIWFDTETGKYYQVKQLDLTKVSEKDAERGFINSLKLDLGNEYHVDEMNS